MATDRTELGEEIRGENIMTNSEPAPFLFTDVRERSVTFCVDTSGSMYNCLHIVKEQLIEALYKHVKHSSEDPLFNLVEFNTEVCQWSDKMVKCTPETVSVASKWIDELSAKTGTNTMDALITAFSDPDCRAVYLVTDGLPDQNPEEILDNVVYISGSRPVHCIYLMGEKADESATEFLEDLAVETYGSFYIASITNKGIVEKLTPIYKSDHSDYIRTTDNNIYPKSKQCNVSTTLAMDPIDSVYLNSTRLVSPVMNPYGFSPLYAYQYYHPSYWSRYRPAKGWLKTQDKLLDEAQALELSPAAGALLIGKKVAARRKDDGYFYLGTVQSQLYENKFLIAFTPCKHGKYKDTVYQETFVYDILDLEDAKRKTVVTGDKVLSPWEPEGERFGPGVVIDGFEKRDAEGPDDKVITVSISNGRTEKVAPDTALWIPDSMYDRLSLELTMPRHTREKMAAQPNYPMANLPGYPTSGPLATPHQYPKPVSFVLESDVSLDRSLHRYPPSAPPFPIYLKRGESKKARSVVKSEDVNALIPGTQLTTKELDDRVTSQLMEHKLFLDERENEKGGRLLNRRGLQSMNGLRKSVSFNDDRLVEMSGTQRDYYIGPDGSRVYKDGYLDKDGNFRYTGTSGGRYSTDGSSGYGSDGRYSPVGHYTADGHFIPEGHYGPDGRYITPGGRYDADGGFVPNGHYAPDGKFVPGGHYSQEGRFVPVSRYVHGGYYDTDGQFVTDEVYGLGGRFGPETRYGSRDMYDSEGRYSPDGRYDGEGQGQNRLYSDNGYPSIGSSDKYNQSEYRDIKFKCRDPNLSDTDREFWKQSYSNELKDLKNRCTDPQLTDEQREILKYKFDNELMDLKYRCRDPNLSKTDRDSWRSTYNNELNDIKQRCSDPKLKRGERELWKAKFDGEMRDLKERCRDPNLSEKDRAFWRDMYNNEMRDIEYRARDPNLKPKERDHWNDVYDYEMRDIEYRAIDPDLSEQERLDWQNLHEYIGSSRNIGTNTDSSLLFYKRSKSMDSLNDGRPQWRYWNTEPSPTLFDTDTELREQGIYEGFRETAMEAPLEVRVKPTNPYLVEWKNPHFSYVDPFARHNYKNTIKTILKPTTTSEAGTQVYTAIKVPTKPPTKDQISDARREFRRKKIIERHLKWQDKVEGELGMKTAMQDQHRQQIMDQLNRQRLRQVQEQQTIERQREAKKNISAEIRARIEENQNRENGREEQRIQALSQKRDHRESLQAQKQIELKKIAARRQEIKQQRSFERSENITKKLDAQEAQTIIQDTKHRNAKINRIQHFQKLEQTEQRRKELQVGVNSQQQGLQLSQIFT